VRNSATTRSSVVPRNRRVAAGTACRPLPRSCKIAASFRAWSRRLVAALRVANSKIERFPALASELVGLNLDVIVPGNSDQHPVQREFRDRRPGDVSPRLQGWSGRRGLQGGRQSVQFWPRKRLGEESLRTARR
jgi:hypothetical protein